MSLLQTRLRWQQIGRSRRPLALKVAVLASFTANPLVPYIGVALEDTGLPADIWVGPYNQIAQECLSDESETARSTPQVLVVWPRLEELWSGRALPLADDLSGYTAVAIELAEACLDAARRWQATLVFVLPAVPELRPLGLGDANMATGVFAAATRAREALRLRLAGQRGVLLIDLEEAIRELGSRSAYDYRMLAVAHIPFSEELFASVGQRLARLIRLSRQGARKVVVLDADNTLWGGVVGEEGPEGVDLGDNGPGAAFRSFQTFLLELRRTGILLALCTKNHESDVRAVFGRREMRLKWEHLSAYRISWQAKSVVLSELAEELNLGLDSLVLIDDNLTEIAEVQAALPDVACIRMPADPAEWPHAMHEASLLDRLPPTAEDLRRAGFYDQEQRRSAAGSTAISKEAYLAQLDVQVDIFAPTAADLPRLSQLVAKTNQMNLNCRRRPEAELATLCSEPRYLVRLAHTHDRYGDYGVVGAYIADVGAEPASLDTFVLSCRALGRGVEEAMIADLFEELAQRGLDTLVATVEAHPRNEPACRFFEQLGCTVGIPSQVQLIPWPSFVTRREQVV